MSHGATVTKARRTAKKRRMRKRRERRQQKLPLEAPTDSENDIFIWGPQDPWANVTIHGSISLPIHMAAVAHESGGEWSDYEVVCSYNLCEYPEQAIWVPGHAPVWRHNRSTGSLAWSFNAEEYWPARKYPLEALFLAADKMRTGMKFDSVDVVAGRHIFKILFELCSKGTSETFRMNLFLAGETSQTLLIENQGADQEQPKGITPGIRHERAATKPIRQLKSTGGHYSALKYKIGDLVCVVNSEIDAIYKDPKEISEDPKKETSEDLDKKTSKKEKDSAERARLRLEAMKQDQGKAGEIKTTTKSMKNWSWRDDFERHLPQLWFGRTPWAMVGHTKINEPVSWQKPRDVAAKGSDAWSFGDWEIRNSTNLGKLATLLGKLRKEAQAAQLSYGRNCAVIYVQGAKQLGICHFDMQRKVLPEDLLGKFWTVG